jgi:hypothetical protein
MTTLRTLLTGIRAWREERRRREHLRRDLRQYRSSAERHELQAILYRYDTTVDDLLAEPAPGDPGDPAPTAAGPATQVWELDLDRPPDVPRERPRIRGPSDR